MSEGREDRYTDEDFTDASAKKREEREEIDNDL